MEFPQPTDTDKNVRAPLFSIVFGFMRSLIVFAVLFLAAGVVVRADVLTLANGDKLKGKLVANADGMITFMSDVLGEITVPEGKAKVEIDPTLEQKAALAKAEEEKKKAAEAVKKPALKKNLDAKFDNVALRSVVRNPATATKVDDTGWVHRVEFGLTNQSGRWSTRDIYMRTENNRRTPKGEVRFLNRYTYGKMDGDTVSDSFTSNLRLRRTLTGKLFLQSTTRFERNKITLLKADAEQGVGLGCNVFSNKAMNIAAGMDGALRNRTYYSKPDGTVDPAGTSSAINFFQDLSLAINPRFSLTQDFVAVINPEDSDDQKYNFNAGLVGRITKAFHIATRFELEYNKILSKEEPRGDRLVDMRRHQRIVATLSYVF